jgi:hypothetical protein
VYRKCLEEVQSICCMMLFSPVSRQEAIQAMGTPSFVSCHFSRVRVDDLPMCVVVTVSGWSDNGWLRGGVPHFGLCYYFSVVSSPWFFFLSCIIRLCHPDGARDEQGLAAPLAPHTTNKMSTSQEECELVISARTWFVLYLFQHQ